MIVAHTLTTHTMSDTSQVEPLLDQIEEPIAELIGDGGYDHKPTYAAVDKHQKQHAEPPRITIPPNVGFQSIQAADHNERKRNQRIIEKHGRNAWNGIVDYGRRSSVEGTFSRWKKIIGQLVA
jgi:hypothetical protein